MPKKKRAYFTVATANHLSYANMMGKTFKHFHPKEELLIFSDQAINKVKDSEILYRATPFFARQLFMESYTELCKIDADSLVLGNLDHIWEGDFDAGVVYKANP